MKDIVVEGTILSISKPRKVKSRTTGKPLTVANAELGDTSGKVVLVLWNERITQVKIGDKVRIILKNSSSTANIEYNINAIKEIGSTIFTIYKVMIAFRTNYYYSEKGYLFEEEEIELVTIPKQLELFDEI